MQTYLHAALGFPGNTLTPEEVGRIRNCESLRNGKEGDVSVQFVPYTEDFEGAGWGTIVLLDFGPVGICGKLLSASEAQALIAQHGTISGETRTKISEALAIVGLERFVECAQLVFYHDNY